MKKGIFIVFVLIISITFSFGQTKSLYDFKAETLEGESFDFSALKGKKVLIVNTASKCGLTPQYKKLQELYEEFGGDDFAIVGFPANNFAKQEPGTNEEIKEFCEMNYGVSFQMMAKISVKGDDIHPVYKWLTNSSENGVLDAPVRWNFQKFLIDRNGQVVDFVAPKNGPKSKRILEWLNAD